MLLFLTNVERIVACIGCFMGGIAVGGEMQGIADSVVCNRGRFVITRRHVGIIVVVFDIL